MFVTNWISTTKIQKISEITNFFRHYFLSRTEVEADNYEVKSYIAGTLTVEEGVTDISHIEQLCDKAAWYTLQGVKLSDKPSMPGVYIHQGRKVIVR